MEKRAIFGGTALPYLLLGPQLVDHASSSSTGRRARRCGSRSCCRTRSGCAPISSGSRTIATCFAQADYYRTMGTTAIFSIAVAVLSLSIALLLAVQADKQHQGRRRLQDAADLALRGRAGGRRRAVALHVPALARPGGARPALARRRLESAAQRQSRHDPGRAGLDLEADQLQFPVLPRRPAVDPASGDRGGGDRRRAAHRAASGPSSSRCCRRRRSSCWSSTSSTCSSTPSASSTP